MEKILSRCDLLAPSRSSTPDGSRCVSSFGSACSSSATALSDERLIPPEPSCSRRRDRWSGAERPARGKSSRSSSVSTRNEGRTGVISTKPAARCQERAKLFMLLTPPASPRAWIRMDMEDLVPLARASSSEVEGVCAPSPPNVPKSGRRSAARGDTLPTGSPFQLIPVNMTAAAGRID